MKNTYVECLNWTWTEKLSYIKKCIGDEIPHKMLCGYAVHSKEEILNDYMHAKYLYCNESGLMSYDGKDSSSPSIGQAQRKVELSELKPKHTQTEYVKVTESIFDLRDEFERGELFNGPSEEFEIKTVSHLAACFDTGTLYRRVEKEIDWRDEVKAMVDDEHSYILIDDNGIVNSLISPKSKVNFLELCRVVLRANGEIE